jgi:hypothetical protein
VKDESAARASFHPIHRLGWILLGLPGKPENWMVRLTFSCQLHFQTPPSCYLRCLRVLSQKERRLARYGRNGGDGEQHWMTRLGACW